MFVVIGQWQSLAMSCFLAFAFVLSLYISGKGPRDDPNVIKRRLLSTSIAAVLAPFSLFLFNDDSQEGPPFLVWIGLPASSIITSLCLPLLVSMSLFLGPLCIYFYTSPSPALWLEHAAGLCSHEKRLTSIRNLIAAPICEEVVYRAVMCSLLIAGGWSFTFAMLCSPVVFGLAHLHHLINLVRYNGYSLQQGVVVVAFQLFYTTLFGTFASFVFLRTGSLLGCIACHCFCNLMGFPDLSWWGAHSALYPHRSVIGATFVVGMVLFGCLLGPLTEPSLYDCWFDTLERMKLRV